MNASAIAQERYALTREIAAAISAGLISACRCERHTMRLEAAVAWLAIARRRSVVRRALTMAAIVAPILIVINHSDAILRGDIALGRLMRMALTFLVPYTVSTVSSVAAIRERGPSA